jgi:hypothetical protein
VTTNIPPYILPGALDVTGLAWYYARVATKREAGAIGYLKAAPIWSEQDRLNGKRLNEGIKSPPRSALSVQVHFHMSNEGTNSVADIVLLPQVIDPVEINAKGGVQIALRP